MKRLARVLSVLVVVVLAAPAWSAEPGMADDVAPVPVTAVSPAYQPYAGPSLLAALSNIVYFPLRFVVTLVTAEAGGITGWVTGGDTAAANAVWQSTDGQAFIRPEVLEGRERLHFGRYD